MSFRKGSPRHVLAGKVFVASMLIMAAFAVYLAVARHQTPNILAGILTFYLITTAWLTARRGDGETRRSDWAVLLIPLAGGSWSWFVGLEKVFSRMPPKDGVPVVMLLAAVGDVRMLVRGGVLGTKRIARHLWRMCFGLFIAAGSFFLGPSKPPTEIAFNSGARAASIPGFIQHNLVFSSHPTSTDFADFLASASPLHNGIRENRN
jgi:hypothetical protein